MAVDQRWLVKGWYEAETLDDWQWYWSTDVASIDPRGVEQIEFKFHTNYSEFTKTPQAVTVLVDDVVKFRDHYQSGFHSIIISCGGARSIVFKVDAVSPARYQRTDGRILGIALYDVIPSTPPEEKGEVAISALNLLPSELPVMLQIEVSTACHLSCVMCSRSRKTGGASEHLLPQVWDRFLATARHVETVNILGTGEPWTHPEFLNYLRQLDDAGVKTAITTNGDLINIERATALGKLRHLRELTFSIDSPDPDLYQKTRGQPLSRTLAALKRAVAAIDNPETVRIHAVVMKDTLESLAGFPALLDEYKVKQLVLRGVNFTTEASRSMVPAYSPEQRETLIKVNDEAQALGVTVNMLPTIPADLIKVRTGQFKDERSAAPDAAVTHSTFARRFPPTRMCFDPWEKAIITRAGTVYPCEGYHLQRAIGSIAHQPFAEIWSSEAYANFRRSLLNGTNIGCRSCERRELGHHPYNMVAAEIIEQHIELGRLSCIRVRNIGTHAWTRDYPLRLATARARDRENSAFYDPSWISLNRVGQIHQDHVAPGEAATLEFRAAYADGADGEYFQLVMEHYCWVPGTELKIGPVGR